MVYISWCFCAWLVSKKKDFKDLVYIFVKFVKIWPVMVSFYPWGVMILTILKLYQVNMIANKFQLVFEEHFQSFERYFSFWTFPNYLPMKKGRSLYFISLNHFVNGVRVVSLVENSPVVLKKMLKIWWVYRYRPSMLAKGLKYYVFYTCGLYYRYDKPLLFKMGDGLSNVFGQNYFWHSALVQSFCDLFSKVW